MNEVGFDVTKLIQTIADLNKRQDDPQQRECLKDELPFIRHAYDCLGALIFMIDRDPIDLRPFIDAA